MEENTTSFSIKSWNEDDRPREKLMLKGKSALSDAELMAIIIGSGNKNESAVDVCKRILASVGHNLNELGRLSIKDLTAFKGVGEAKSISIIAALELGKRRRLGQALQRKKVTSSNSVFELLQPVIGDLAYEEFWVVYLNNSNKVLRLERLSKGGITGTVVDIRLAMKTAITTGAVGLILAHNHPSGSLKPSNADIRLTKKFRVAGDSLDIKVLDHLIITENAYFSFTDEQLL